jgi:16S rRNA (guanine527-N7)-methyltransferase
MSRPELSPLANRFTRAVDAVEADLQVYADLLVKWQGAHNLVSRETLGELWTRHFLDSLQLLDFVRDGDRLFLDLGSGGGFPALPLAIALKQDEGARFELYEPVNRKAAFLRTVARTLELDVTVHATRIESRDSRETPDVVTSRALAPLPALLALIHPQIGPQTRLLLHKGREHGEEIRNAATHWQFDVIQHNSRVESGSVILEITNLAARSEL